MDSMASRQNDSAFRTSSSYAISRRTDNSVRRQSSTIASSSSFKPGYSPHRAPYNTRESLSKSYDSPEGIRRMSQASAKKVSSPLRRAASPPPCSSSRKQHIYANGRNQTILDDAAWMSERICNLQKTGFLRYPSMSKLRDPGDISPSLDSLPASYKDDEGMYLPCSSPSCFNQGSTLQHSQTVINQADEPLSAFRLSEVTLSEEDLLTDISSSMDASTCNSTPVSLQSGRNFNQIASDFYQGTSLLHNVGKEYHKYIHQSNVSPNNGSVKHPNSVASLECSTSNVRGDLLLRLEALQYRAELSAQEGNDTHSNNPNPNQEKQYSKHFYNEQDLHRDEDTLPSNQKRGACIQQSNAASAASPTQSNLSIDSVSCPQKPEKSFDSTCWLKAINENVKGDPCVSHLIHSSSRNIRPEYYLPLSREEEPVLEGGVSLFSSFKGGKRTEMRHDNIRRLALGGMPSVRQRRSEEIRPGKSVSNHKQTFLAPKSRRSLESSMDSVDGSVKARSMSSFYMTGRSSSKPSPVAARKTHPLEARASQSPLCAEHKSLQEQRNIITQSFEMKALAFEGDGQTRNCLENRLEYDGESSWISEENVEGFLRSQSFAVGEVDALRTSNECYKPALDTNSNHGTSGTSSSLPSERPSKNKSADRLHMKEVGIGPLVSSHTETACFDDTAVKSSNESMAGIPMLDHWKESPQSAQGGSTITNQICTPLQLLEAVSYPDHISHQSVWLNYDSMACCKDILDNEQLKGSCNDAGAKEQILLQEDSDSYSDAPQKSLYRVIENKVTLGAQIVALKSEQELEGTYIGPSRSARCTFHTSIPLLSQKQDCPLSLDALSSPEDLVEDQHWPVVAKRNKKAAHTDKIHSQSLLEGGSPKHKIFARIVRSLSFSEQEKSKLKSSSKLQAHRDLSEPKSTSFSHYWIPNSAYSLNNFDLQNNERKDSRRTEEEKLHQHNFSEAPNDLKLQQTNDLTKEDLSKGLPSPSGRSEISHGGNEASLILSDNTCMANSKIKRLAVSPCAMTHTVLASGTIRIDCGTVGDSDAPLSSTQSSQQCHDLDLDNPIEILCRAQVDPMSESVLEDNSSWQQLKNSSRAPKVVGTAVDKKCHRQAETKFTVGEDLSTKILAIYKNEPAETEPDVVYYEKLTLSKQHMSKASFDNQNNKLMLEDATKDEMVSKIPCASGPKNGGRGETSTADTSSLVSIYKNPLWLDEVRVDFENHHGSQNQEFLGLPYSDERERGFLDSDKNMIGFSKRSLGEVWDTYEGMGGFIGPFPNSPPCEKERVSEANHILAGFDNPLNSSDSNSFALNSAWDVESSAGKKLRTIGEEVEDGHVSVCEPHFSENFSIFEDFVVSKMPGSDTKETLGYSSQVDQHQQLAPSPETMKSQSTSHDAFSLNLVEVGDITGMVDENSSITSISSPLAHLEMLEAVSPLKENSTTQTKFSRKPDGLENCLREQSVWPSGPFPTNSSLCTKLTKSNVAVLDAAIVAKESTVNDFLKCSTWENMMSLAEAACQTDDAKAGREACNKLDHNNSTIRKELSMEKSGASINIERTSDRKMQSDQLREQYNSECLQPLDLKFDFEKVIAPAEMQLNDAVEDGEEVKQVTFIYSDSKEPHKDSQAVEASLPEVPLEVLSTWVLSFFSHATKGGSNFKKKEQNQLLIQDKTQEHQAELNKIGKKVEALEAEIDRFKHENRKLQNLVKCMIRKMKQLQQGFRGRKRHGSNRGFMTCIYSVRVKRSRSNRSKILRKS